MTASAFFDTHVLIYALTVRAGSKHDPRSEIAERTLSSGGVVSVQVLNEFADVASCKFKKSWDAIDRYLEVIHALCGRAVPLTAETQFIAMDICRNYGYRIYNSLILAAAQQAGCRTVFSEDMQHGQVVESVRIVNPFLGI